MEEQSRRAKSSPLSLAEEIVAAVAEARDAHPTWGPKKIQVLLPTEIGEALTACARMKRSGGRQNSLIDSTSSSVTVRPKAYSSSSHSTSRPRWSTASSAQ